MIIEVTQQHKLYNHTDVKNNQQKKFKIFNLDVIYFNTLFSSYWKDQL